MRDRHISREPVWSIPAGWWPAYFWIFSTKMTLWAIVMTRYEIIYGGKDSPEATALAVVASIALATPAAIISTTMLLEIVRLLMITAEYIRTRYLEPLKQSLRDEGRKEGHTQGIQEGREEMRLAAAEWHKRQKEAHDKGIPFDEPPPWEL